MNKKEVLVFTKKHYTTIILAILILAQTTQISFFITNNNTNPIVDSAWHLSNTYFYKSKIFNTDNRTVEELTKKYPLFGYGFYGKYPQPNIFYTTAALIPYEFNEILIVQLIFISILILSVYGIGKNLYGKNIGLLAAFITSTYPLALNLTRRYLLDMPLAAFVALSIFLLIKTNYFQDKKYFVLFILSLLIETFTKKTFPIFVLPIAFYYLILMYKNREIKIKNKILTGSILLLVTVIMLAYTFYMFPEQTIKKTSEVFIDFDELEDIPTLGSFLKDDLSLIYSIALLIALPFFLKKSKHKTFILFSLIPIILILLMDINIKLTTIRYFFPSFFGFALITSAGLMSIKQTNIKSTLIILLIFLGSIQFILSAFNYDKSLLQKVEIPLLLDAINNSQINNKTICILAQKRGTMLTGTPSADNTNIPYYAISMKYEIDYVTGHLCNPHKYNFIIINTNETTQLIIFNQSKSEFKQIHRQGEVAVYERIRPI